MHNAQCTIGEWTWEGPALSRPGSEGCGWGETGTSHARGRDEARPSPQAGCGVGGQCGGREGPALSGPWHQMISNEERMEE